MNKISQKGIDKIKNRSYYTIFFESTSSPRDLFLNGHDLKTASEYIQNYAVLGKMAIFVSQEVARKINEIELDRSTGNQSRITFGEVQKLIRESRESVQK